MVEMRPRQVEVEKDKKGIKIRNKKIGNVAQAEKSSSRATVQVVKVRRNNSQRRASGSGASGKKTKRGGRKQVQCHNCGGDHFLCDCKEWKEIKEKLRSSLGN